MSAASCGDRGGKGHFSKRLNMLDSIANNICTYTWVPILTYDTSWVCKSDELFLSSRFEIMSPPLSTNFPVSAFPLCHGAFRSLHINSLSFDYWCSSLWCVCTYILDSSFSSLKPSLLYNRCNNLLHEKAMMYPPKWKAPVECIYVARRSGSPLSVSTYAASALLGHAGRMGSAQPAVVRG